MVTRITIPESSESRLTTLPVFMKRWLLSLLTLACACSPSTQPASSLSQDNNVVFTPANTIVGVGSHGTFNESVLLHQLGTITRITFYTRVDTAGYHEQYRARLALLRAQNVQPLVVVHDFIVRDTADRTMAQLVRDFPGTTWQVGNEYDVHPDFAEHTGAGYAAWMRKIVKAMRAVDPNVFIVGMGLVCTDGQDYTCTGPGNVQNSFTRNYLLNGGPILNAWAIHSYGSSLKYGLSIRVPAMLAALEPPRGRSLASVPAQSPVMPIWITEIGADKAGIEAAYGGGRSLAQIDTIQADEDMAAVNEARRLGVARMYFYQLSDGLDYGFGFVRADQFTKRPVYNAFKAAFGQP
ncbi:MAG: hypothetical protein ABJB66_13880 [Gemmatimonadaceae bacterium]